MNRRIKQNFYTLWGYDFVKIPREDLEKLKDDPFWKDKKYWYEERRLPDGRLYAGWSFRYPTKLTKDDLPEDYIFLSNYKKCGYIRTAGVKSVVYSPSPFHNHAFKDDFLYISYTKDIAGYKKELLLEACDEYIFGNDIIDFIVAVQKFSPDLDVAGIKDRMVEQYNLYCNEMNEWPTHNIKKISSFEELCL